MVSQGLMFEERVARLFEGLNIQRNILIEKNGIRAEIDIIVSNGDQQLYIECKYRKDKVRLGEVTKFVSVLDLFGINHYNAIIVTNNGYTKRAELYAKKQGVKLYTIHSLEKLLGVKK